MGWSKSIVYWNVTKTRWGIGEEEPPPAWTPADILTTLWLDASDESRLVFSNGNSVARWYSKGTITDKFVKQDNESQLPVLENTPNMPLPSLKFLSADNKNLHNESINVGVDLVVAVTEMTDTNVFLEGFLSNSHDGMNIRRDDNNISYRSAGDSYVDGGDLSNPDGNTWINGFDTNQVTANEGHIISVQVGVQNSHNFQDIQISGATNTFRCWDGHIGEIIICENVSDREYLEGYLAWKWNLQDKLPDTHPFKNGAPVKVYLVDKYGNYILDKNGQKVFDVMPNYNNSLPINL